MNRWDGRVARQAGGAAPGEPRPGPLAGIPAGRLVDVDVREELRAGQEPFARIMAARAALAPGQVLRVRAIFEPAPLYAVLGRQGLAHWTERLAEDDWRVWFYPSETPPGSPPGEAPSEPPGAVPSPAGPGVVVLDVRDLEPPEPMVRTLEALQDLPAGGTLVQLNARVPQFLLPRLTEAGFEYEVREEEQVVRTFIRRGEPPRPNPEESSMSQADAPAQLDVRVIPPREKHSTIFQTFDALAPGEAFVLVNDHDPFPLRYQFQAERPEAFDWSYLEQGPVVWRVLISRR
jgi:uncharacterized protein (DUF2249 family)